jgi:uncharacterized repeat protein (TIGR01451 family)
VSNATGIWHWVATYNGDSHNNAVSSGPLDEPVTIPEQADLALAKTVNPAQVSLGTAAVFTLVVHNNGPDAATGVVVADPLPAGLVFVSAVPSQGTVSPGVLWVVGGLAPGATAVLQVTAQVAAVGPMTNAAFVRADQFDPDLANNRDSAFVVGMESPADISKRSFLTAPADLAAVDALNRFFVDQVFRDLLGRPADATGLAFWSGMLDQGAVSPTQVALAVENSPEYLGDEVDAAFRELLHRPADPASRSGGAAFLAAGGTVPQLDTVLAGSGEYVQSRGGGTNGGFLNALYADALGRAMDPVGLAFWTQQLSQGLSPAQVAATVFGSAEHDARVVQGLYQQFLRRPADPVGLNFMVTALLQGARQEQVAALLMGSDEYLLGRLQAGG